MNSEEVIAKAREAMMQLFTDPENQPSQFGTVTVEYMNREIEAERERIFGVLLDMHDKTQGTHNVLPTRNNSH